MAYTRWSTRLSNGETSDYYIFASGIPNEHKSGSAHPIRYEEVTIMHVWDDELETGGYVGTKFSFKDVQKNLKRKKYNWIPHYKRESKIQRKEAVRALNQWVKQEMERYGIK